MSQQMGEVSRGHWLGTQPAHGIDQREVGTEWELVKMVFKRKTRDNAVSSPKFPFSYPDITINSDLMGNLYLRPRAVKGHSI